MIKDIILYIIIALLVASNIYLIYKTRNVEKFTVTDDINQAINDIYKADINAIRNLSNISTTIMSNNDSLTIPAKTTNVSDLVANNINTNNNITTVKLTSGTIDSGNISSTGDINSVNITSTGDIISNANVKLKSSLCVDDLCIDKNTLKKILSNTVFAGFGANGAAPSYIPLYEGTFKLYGSIYDSASRFSYGTGDVIDIIYVNKGWRITVYDGAPDSSSRSKILENTVDTVPKCYMLNGQPGWTDTMSSYTAEWIGY